VRYEDDQALAAAERDGGSYDCDSHVAPMTASSRLTHPGAVAGFLAAGPQHGDEDPAGARAAGLIAVAEDLAGEFSLRPLLERILLRCTELLGCDAGSICSVDEAAGTYRKEADIGVACQSGQVFPLTEGMTGAVVARRGPVWFARYSDVRGGHVDPAARATLRGVIGVPLEWRGRIIGACIVFSRDARRSFGPADARLLQLFAKHAAIALANARMHEQAEERARAEAAAAERDRLLNEVHDTITQRLVSVRVHLEMAEQRLAEGAADPAGIAPLLRQASVAAREALVEARLTLLGLAASPLDGRTLHAALQSEANWAQSTARLEVRFVSAGAAIPLDGRVAREVLRVAREALTNIVRHARARSARLGLVYEREAVSLLVQDDGEGFDPQADSLGDRFGLRAMTERARDLGGTVDVDSLPGWGTRIRARFPYARDHVTPPAGPRLRVLVAAGQPVLRAGLSRLLSWTEPGIDLVGEAGTATEALEACLALRPDVVLADLSLTAADGTGAVRMLLGQEPGLAVVALCDVDDDERVADAMRAGARGCVDTGVDGPELARAVVAAGRGQAILSGPVLRQLHQGLRGDALEVPLTEREREVRKLMELGLPDKLIAEKLVLSVKTVEKHAGAVLRKTGARNRTELAALAGRARAR
jgi:signal transduction histidine kinase/DNA-binding NarL/FixJ family response regulator